MTKLPASFPRGFQLIYWVFCKPISLNNKIDEQLNSSQKYTDSALTRTKHTRKLLFSCILPICMINFFFVSLFYIIYALYNFSLLNILDFIVSILLMGLIVFAYTEIAIQMSRFNIFIFIKKVQSVSLYVAFGVAISIFLGVTLSVLYVSNTSGLEMGMFFGLELGVSMGVSIGIALGVVISAEKDMVIMVVTYALIAMLLSVVFGAFGVGFGVASILSIIRFYLWLPELLWVFFLYTRQRFLNYTPSVCSLPFYFDELIILPLPFLEKWLVENYQVNSVATLETLDYLTSNTNQQPLVFKTRIAIVVKNLDSCHNFNRLINVHREFNWLPNPLPKEFDPVIQQLLEISQDCNSAKEASSVFRTSELLKIPEQRLQDLQKTVSASKSKHRLTLAQTIQRWLNIVSTAKANYDQQIASSQEIPLAYIAGNALNPNNAQERFKGREDIFQEIETFSLRPMPPVLLLYGGRRTGKTSSLKYLPYKVNSTLIPLLVDLQGTAVTNQISSFAWIFAQQIQKFASDHRQYRLDINLPNRDQINKDPFVTLLDWLTEIEQLAPHKRFLLCLDEFERLSEGG